MTIVRFEFKDHFGKGPTLTICQVLKRTQSRVKKAPEHCLTPNAFNYVSVWPVLLLEPIKEVT